jgi:AmmeMemoRadiSam system protein B
MRALLLLGLAAVLSPSESVIAQITRGLVDTVGFARFPVQMERIVALADSLEKDSLRALDQRLWAKAESDWVMAISPHDDYVYAGRVYWHLFRKYKARHAILIGVAHRAWRWGEADRLIFDSFDRWRGPWGPVRVWSLRDSLRERLPAELFTVSNNYHAEEHSLEALIPWLQFSVRDVEILPVLVPYMHFERMETIARELAGRLAELVRAQGLNWGSDFVIVISSDAVHYGDESWGGRNYAPFGADLAGYERAVQREYALLQNYLLDAVSPARLRLFLYELVDPKDLQTYRITWCGRFSIPFGLLLGYYLSAELGRHTPTGHLLRYDTSWGLGQMPVTIGGLGVTAPRSLRHWVGYAAVVYF